MSQLWVTLSGNIRVAHPNYGEVGNNVSTDDKLDVEETQKMINHGDGDTNTKYTSYISQKRLLVLTQVITIIQDVIYL